MSRIGKLEIIVPADVTVSVGEDNTVTVKGPKDTLSRVIDKCITVNVEGNKIHLTPNNNENKTNALHGLYRQLINNMVIGVSKGFKKSLTINGVGYKVAKQGNKIVMGLGFSHPVEFEEVHGITLSCPSATEIVVEGADKELVGLVAAKIKAIRPVEPYHGYGIRYTGETVILKAGKAAKGGKK